MDILENLLQNVIINDKIFVFLLSTAFGVIARAQIEAVFKGVQKKKVKETFIIALFINYLIHGIMVNLNWGIDYYGQIMAVGAFLCWQIINWIDKNLWNKIAKKIDDKVNGNN